MYKFLAVSLLFLLSSAFSVRAQNKDSLWSVYENIKLADTTRYAALRTLAKTYMRSDPDSAILLLNMQVKRARKTRDEKLEANALNYIALAHFNKGDYPGAMK